VIWTYLEEAVKLGYEGLVLRTADRWYRVKPEATADVYITGWFEQLDVKKNPKGQLGGFDTNYGKVTAFSEEMRKKLWENPSQYIGQMMTVQYKERYHTGKFRYAVKFLHLRQDKNEETFDTEPPLK
jgi:ATP-dependent DNA ligase